MNLWMYALSPLPAVVAFVTWLIGSEACGPAACIALVWAAYVVVTWVEGRTRKQQGTR